jgi:peptidyl-tRNA hydrolase
LHILNKIITMRRTRVLEQQFKRAFMGVSSIVYGIGNWFYPLSRESIGLYALERYAKRNQLYFDFIPSICCEGIMSRTGVALLKPRTYLMKNMGQGLAMAIDALKLKQDNITVLHYDDSIKVGEMKVFSSPESMTKNEALDSLNEHVAAGYTRVALGVGKRKSDDYFYPTLPQCFDEAMTSRRRELYLKNVFTEEEQRIVDTVLDRFIDELLHGEGDVTTSGFTRLNTL